MMVSEVLCQAAGGSSPSASTRCRARGAGAPPAQRPRRWSGGRLHEGPRAVHSVVKRLPRLAVGRCVAGLEHIEAELSIGRAPEVSEVALLEERAVADGSAGDTVKVIGGRDRARVVAREDED